MEEKAAEYVVSGDGETSGMWKHDVCNSEYSRDVERAILTDHEKHDVTSEQEAEEMFPSDLAVKEVGLFGTMVVENEVKSLTSTSNEICWRAVPLKVLKFWVLVIAVIFMGILGSN